MAARDVHPCATPTGEDEELALFNGVVPMIRYQLRDELRSANLISDDVRQLLRKLSIEDRNLVVDRNCFALRECTRLKDVEFVIEECAATVFGGGAHCALCTAIRQGDVDRVSLYIEYLSGKRPLKYQLEQGRGRQQQQQQWGQDATVLSQLFIGNLLPQPCTVEAKNTADLLFFYGASLTVEVNGGTVLEWAVRASSRPWVRYLLDKGAIPCPRSGYGKDALRLAAILDDEGVYEELLTDLNVHASCRDEATALRDASQLISCIGPDDQTMSPQQKLLAKQLLDKLPCPSTAAAASETNEPIENDGVSLTDRRNRPPLRTNGSNQPLSVIRGAATVVQRIFGGSMPPLFAHSLIAHSCAYLPRLDATTSDIVDLLTFAMSSLDVFVFSSRYFGQQDLIRLIRASRHNNLELRHLSHLLVAYCRRQLRCVSAHKRLHDWPSAASTLLELALQNTASLSDAIAKLDSTVHRAAVLAVAVDLWRYRFSKTQQLEELVRLLIADGTFVGLSGMLVYDDTPLSATRLRRADAVGRMIHEAACCQLNYPSQCLANPPAHWRMRSLVCLAAAKLNRCLDIEQFDRLPHVLINTRGMLIPLPYLVDSHSAGLLRSQRLRRPLQPSCPCLGLGHRQLLDTSFSSSHHR